MERAVLLGRAGIGVCCGTRTSKIEREQCTQCAHCNLPPIVKNGRDRRGAQVYRCAHCGRSLTALTGTPFSGHSFPPAVIGLAGLWYFRSRLSDADVVEWLAERYIQVDPSTVFDGVQKFAPWYQDGVQNEAKHAPGALVTITLSWTGEELQLRIRDDGPGFDLEAVWPKARLGLVSMRERAEFVGGSFVLHSTIDAGTEIEVRVPWSSMQRAG